MWPRRLSFRSPLIDIGEEVELGAVVRLHSPGGNEEMVWTRFPSSPRFFLSYPAQRLTIWSKFDFKWKRWHSAAYAFRPASLALRSAGAAPCVEAGVRGSEEARPSLAGWQ